MTNIIVDISELGYPGETISLKEVTGGDIMFLNRYVKQEKKKGEEPDAFTLDLMLLNRIIDYAPFENNMATLQAQPLKLLLALTKEVEKAVAPLEQKMPSDSPMTQ